VLARRRDRPGFARSRQLPKEVAIRSLLIPPGSLDKAPARGAAVAGVLRRVGRFVVHYLEMCMVMCACAIVLSVAFFGAATLLGYTDLPQRAPELSALVVAVNLSLPMTVWMRLRGMPWRPTLEMSGATMLVGLLLIAGYWLDVVGPSSLIEVQASLACPLMLAVMLLRFGLYSSHAGRHAHAD
jgi:hypothetical protein